ncbi:MAG: 2'-5' RNA ligase family protein [Actinomycetota bacterium]|nr:2'-5' RNA ligase family protein [Actinomycetota bacterium]
MPPLFSTYEEAWAYFAAADQMESFSAQYAEAEAHLLTWYIPVAAERVPGVIALQKDLTDLPDMEPIPPERLHVSVAPATITEQPEPRLEADLLHQAEEAWAGHPPFDIELSGVNVFPTAVVVEGHGAGPAGLLDRLLESGYWRGLPWRAPNREIFLPHLTVAIATRRRGAEEVRTIVEPHRGEDFGTIAVHDIDLCRIPVARSRLLQPWDVVGRVHLGGTQ